MLKKSAGLILLASIFVFSVAIIGCSQLQQSQGIDGGGGREYFPNTDGYSWSYVGTFSSTQSGDAYPPLMITETSAVAQQTFDGTAVLDPLTVQILKGESTITVEALDLSYSHTQTVTGEYYYRVTDSAVYYYGSYGNQGPEATYLVFPLEIGNSWVYSGTSEVLVEDIEDVTVPAGTYSNCYKLSSTGGGLMWLAQNVGIVKFQSGSNQVSVENGVVVGVATTVSTYELTSKNF
ncbi:MAG: hypothetical protein HQ596_03130 [Candidatus Saganbacteria bacterium]|nr:hypothetical protein [Candidatus Saganbacteria bacterium]